MNPTRLIRYQWGLTQKVLADAAGTSQPTIADYESGKKSPTLATLETLAHSLGAEVSISFVPPMTRSDKRSLAYHQMIVERLRRDPAATTTKARKNLELMSKTHPGARDLFDLWDRWLSLSTNDLIGCCLDSSLLARDMRQVTPFAGVLTPKERVKVIKELREGVFK